MKLLLTILTVTLFIVGCDGTHPSVRTIQPGPLPDELKDCRFYKIDPGGFEPIFNIVRCPNSQVTVTSMESKTKKITVTIDGKEYQPIDNNLNIKK